MRVHLYLNSVGLESERAGEEVTAQMQFFSQSHYIHVDVHSDEVEDYPCSFALIKGSWSR